MKIEIDLSNALPLSGQFEAVDKYIKDNIKSTISFNCWGEAIRDDKNEVVFSTLPILKETKKGTGTRIETSYRNYHVSCYKTKGGTYKFKVWNTV